MFIACDIDVDVPSVDGTGSDGAWLGGAGAKSAAGIADIWKIKATSASF